MTGRIVELIKGKKYQVIIEAGKNPKTGRRSRIKRTVNGRKVEAEKLCADIIYKLEHGTYIKPDKTTLAEYLRKWLKTYAANKAPSTYNGYKRIVEAHIIPQLGRVQLSKLQPMQIQEYYTNRLREGRRDGKGGLSAASVQRHHALLRQALHHAVKWGFLSRNPADLTEPPTPEQPEIFPLEPDQLDEVLELAQGKRDEYLYIVAAYTGMREGELLALTWNNVDLTGDDPVCRVRQTVGYISGQGFVFRPTAKHKKGRREIPLMDITVTALKQQKKMLAQEMLINAKTYNRENNLVFPNSVGEPMDPSGLGRRFKTIAREAGFPEVRFHDLRHTHATMLLKQGIHPKIVQERLGHQTIGITMDTYTHVIKGMQKEAVEKMNEYLKNKKRHQKGTKEQKDRL
ncbi:MAG: site-specific integrase [Syntrophomonadaceae bacterium]|nr:site-specific integrase [Syntrophomonadaceae bacterium]